MAALIGALRATLSADTANFEQGMKRAQRQAASSAGAMGKSFGVIKAGLAGLVSGLSVGLLTNVIKNALDYAGSLGEISQQIGVTTRDLQVFRYAAGQNGVSTEELDKGLGKLTVTLGQVAAGAKAPAKALDAIGISAKDLAGLDTGQAFRKIADGLSGIEDRAQRAAVEVALFGRTGAKLDTLLAGGSQRINELSAAADKLGIVLSDEQIQRADDTADKLDALKTVLSANIAGAVANNSDAILGLANSLVTLINTIPQAIQGWKNMAAAFDAFVYSKLGMEEEAAKRRGDYVGPNGESLPGRSVTRTLAPAGAFKPKPPASTIKQFLGGGGGSKRAPRAAREDHSAEDALRDAYQFDEQLRRAQQDVVRATQSLSIDYHDRHQFAIQLLDLDKQSYDAELAYQVELFKLTKGKEGLSAAQAEQLRLLYDENDSLQRQAADREHDRQQYEDKVHLADTSLSLQREVLESEGQLAETADEQRKVQLRLLDLAYQQEKARNDAILADKESTDAQREEARLRNANLGQTYGNDRAGVIANTRGPMEQWQHDAMNTSEAMEDLKVQGIEGAIDALGRFTEGWGAMREAALAALKDIVAQLIRVQLMKMAASLIGGGTGSFASVGASGPTISTLPGFATGGSFNIMGKRGVDQNTLSLNGLPIARVSHGERINVDNDNPAQSAGTFHFNNYARMTEQEARRTGMQAAAGYRSEMAKASRRGF